ncbi:hypothetical protein [Ectothiorhodospira lacustris]|uniref:hypothetical protein n=1 Tax=Ectothiorhodospira lacustris TaxID=2899127 RepID=UPI001EE9024E|nr:hypothetical protein [Ectothiorhodospira lacustris]MCG5511114.1 hypothetical protein [Ectothiorhodospira lacustris]MCG5522879.1 hypothetical protein [Ectothiorhodospira lacustris]
MAKGVTAPMPQAGLNDWKAVWNRLLPLDRHRAVISFLERLREPASRLELVCDATLKTLARRKGFRVETLKRMNNHQLADVLLPHVPVVMGAREWTLLFLGYFADYKAAIMCRFLDLCDVPHDERGFVAGGDDKIHPPTDMVGTKDALIEEFGAMEVGIYFHVLKLMDPGLWQFLDPVLPALDQAMAAAEAVRQQERTVAEEETTARAVLDVSEEFTQLDRVVMEQIIATLAEEDRALKPDELVDLVESVHALDTGRKRSYFHLGFLDALLPGRRPDMGRPEMNDERRQWYLAGLLSGYVRQQNHAAIRDTLHRYAAIFRAASSTPGGAGAGMLTEVHPYLLIHGFQNEATRLLRGQRRHLTPATARLILQSATGAIRRGDAAIANVLLVELREGLPHVALDTAERASLEAGLGRRLGQALQLQGNFSAAKEAFAGLIAEGRLMSPRLHADMGLVLGGFRSLAELVLPPDLDRVRTIQAQLRQGERYFTEAVERFGPVALGAHYALGVRDFLRWMEDDGGDEAREQALMHVNAALIGMMTETDAQDPERSLLVDRCRFMQAVLMMARLDAASAQAAMESWRALMAQQDQPFWPAWGIQRLLECADLVDPALAGEIAESLWCRHGEAVLPLIDRPEWFARSPRLLDDLQVLCRAGTDQALQVQWDRWSLLMSAALSAGRLEAAQEGLDGMEHLAHEDSRFCEPMLDLLEAPARLDPAWSETDILRARFRLYRRLGRDPEAFSQLRALFFALRDARPLEAAQTLALFRECGAAPAQYEDLVLPGIEADHDEDSDLLEQLEGGAELTVLFVGGNEIQARYSDELSREIAAQWPGVRVEFRHTGWSSNWGRDVNHLKRQAAGADAVVLMTMMRTTLGRVLREALNDPPRPWIPCTGTGRQALFQSIRHAALIGLRTRRRSVVAD